PDDRRDYPRRRQDDGESFSVLERYRAERRQPGIHRRHDSLVAEGNQDSVRPRPTVDRLYARPARSRNDARAPAARELDRMDAHVGSEPAIPRSRAQLRRTADNGNWPAGGGAVERLFRRRQGHRGRFRPQYSLGAERSDVAHGRGRYDAPVLRVGSDSL